MKRNPQNTNRQQGTTGTPVAQCRCVCGYFDVGI